jgi:general secretion pathway protein D
MPLVSVEDPPGKDTNNELKGNKKSTDDDEVKQKDEFFRGTGRFVGYTGKTAKANGSSASGKFTLNFEDAALSEVIKVILSDTLNESYMVNPKVVGKVTLQTSRPLTKQELLPTLELLLQVNNAALIKDANMYRIEPLNKALKGGISPTLAGKGQSSGYQVQVMPLQYVGVEEIQEIIKPMVSPTTIVRVDKARNLLMVAGTAKELEGIKHTVATFDVDYMEGMSFGIFPLHNSDVETVKKELEEIFDSAEGAPMAEMFRMIPLERMNAILAITPQPRYLDKIKLWITRLDKSTSGAGGGVIVYPVQHIKAVELADTLNEIFAGGEKRKTKDATVAPGRKAVNVRGNKKKKDKQRTATSRKSGTAEVSGIGDVKIIADEANNTIIIVATPQEYETIKTVIKQLDVMPLQVLLETTIIEVRLTDSTKYGVSWGFGANGNITSTITPATDDTPGETTITGDGASRGMAQLGSLAATTAAAAGSGGFSYVIGNAANTVQAAIEAFGTDDNVNVLATPSIMVLNNQEARLHVGDTIPIRTSDLTSADSVNPNNNSTNVIGNFNQEDTGITLEITPRVNASGVVIMDILQKFNQVQPQSLSGSNIDSPVILKRELESSVAIHGGETVILGGVIDGKYTDITTGIPWFKDLPYIGPLFGTTERSEVKTELIVLITPRVVQNKKDARRVTREYQLKLPGLYELGDNLRNSSEDLRQLNERRDIHMDEYRDTPDVNKYRDIPDVKGYRDMPMKEADDIPVKEYRETLN